MTILAGPDDYEFPHVDWVCRRCGGQYGSAGMPDVSRCIEGHCAGWRLSESQVEEYIETLESLEVGDGVVVVECGASPRMGPVEATGDGWLRTEALDYRAREVRWSRGGEDRPSIEWRAVDEDEDEDQDAYYDVVHHIERVEVLD